MSVSLRFILSVSCFALVAVSGHAVANPIKTVGTGIVNKGQNTVEFRTGYSSDTNARNDEGRFQTRQLYDHGFTDWYAVRFTAMQDDRGLNEYEHEAFMLDNRVQVFERADHGFDGGFRVTYMMRDGDKKPDIAEMRWINHIPFGDNYEFRHHVIVQHQAGPDSRSGVMPELRWQVTRPTIGKHRAGVEMFNEFGNLRDQRGFKQQIHDAGLVLTGPVYNALRYHAGYRHGLSENAPDHSVKFFLGYDF